MGMITDEQINEAIENCIWRKKTYDVYICMGDIAPCTKHINDGLCFTLKELFGREGADMRGVE